MKLPTVNRTLLPVKAAYFFYYFSFSCIIPFIPVFLREVGMNAEQAGIAFGTRTIIQFFTGPIWGGWADKKRKHRLFLIVQIVCSTIFMFSSPFIPKLLPNQHLERKTTNFDNATAHVAIFMSSPTKASYVMSSSYKSSTEHRGAAVSLGISTTALPAYASKSLTNGSSATSGRPTTIAQKRETTNENLTTFASLTEGDVESKATKVQTVTTSTTARSILSTNKTIKVLAREDQDDDDEEEAQSSNNTLLFAVMTIIFNIGAIFDGGIPQMIDTYLMEMVQKSERREQGKKVDFGKQRLWGAVGYALAAFASGTAVQLSGVEEPNYTTMFYIYLASNTCLLIACTQLYKERKDEILNKEEKQVKEQQGEKPKIAKQLFETLSQFHVLFWFATIFIMGLANGLLYGYMFWFIEDLNGHQILMGLSILVACATEVMMFPYSEKCIKKLGGNVAAVGIAVFSYAIRFLGFSYLTNAWYILLLQLVHAIGFAMFWAAAVIHTTVLAPSGMTTTLLGVLNGIHFGVATGLAGILGGLAYKTYGGRVVYRFFAGVCSVWSVFVLIFVFYEKRRERRRKPQTDTEDAETGVKLLEKTENGNHKAVDKNVGI